MRKNDSFKKVKLIEEQLNISNMLELLHKNNMQNFNIDKLWNINPLDIIYQIFKNNNMFDEIYYINNNRDIDIIKFNPLFHYIYFGCMENRKARLVNRVLNFRKERNKIFSHKIYAALATIEERRSTLKKVIDSIINQVDKLFIFFNGYHYIPDYIKYYTKIEYNTSQNITDKGDAGKFFWVDKVSGFYFTCDDDIVYPDNYVELLINSLSEYDNSCVCGFHGSLIKDGFDNYYDKKSRYVITYGGKNEKNTYVHIIGTGCCAFHTDCLSFSWDIFKNNNMADVYFSLYALKNNVPLVVIKHDANQLETIKEHQDESINVISRKNITSKKNSGSLQTELIKKNYPLLLPIAKKLNILIIGRFNSYKKGGIHKSCLLIEDALRYSGNNVITYDLSENISISNSYDCAIIYPGDPTRPDYKPVECLIAKLISYDIKVIVNLSYNTDKERTKWICNKIKELNNTKKLVWLMLFSESATCDPEFSDIFDRLVVIPKTITTSAVKYNNFEGREGICIGETAKIQNNKISCPNIEEYISSLHKTMPHVNLYSYNHYSNILKFKNVKCVDYMGEGFGEWLSHRKLFISFNKFVTFEMVPCECQSYGTPVLYYNSPQSLNEYIGINGIKFSNPEELSIACNLLYNNISLWNDYSISSVHNGNRFSYDKIRSFIDLKIRLLISR